MDNNSKSYNNCSRYGKGFQYLHKWGWRGNGLGKYENGIVDILRVSVKNDHFGIGAKKESKWENWWESLYDSAISKVRKKRKRNELDKEIFQKPSSSSCETFQSTENEKQHPLVYGKFISKGIVSFSDSNDCMKNDSMSSFEANGEEKESKNSNSSLFQEKEKRSKRKRTSRISKMEKLYDNCEPESDREIKMLEKSEKDIDLQFHVESLQVLRSDRKEKLRKDHKATKRR